MKIKANVSLPGEVLEVLLKSTRLRLSKHDSIPDFVSLRALSNSPHRYSSAPWALTMNQVQHVIEATRASILSLLPRLSPSDQAYIAADPSWWGAEYYRHYVDEGEQLDPISQLEEKVSRLQNLSEDLLIELIDAIKVLSSNKLLDRLG